MTVDSPEQLFEHELEDIYYAEHELLDVLDELADQTEDEEATQAFQQHRDQTEGHVERLEEVFEMIGEPPEEEECEGIQGLVEEHDEFLDQDPDQEILDVFNLTAAQKTEHYEISAYENLTTLAEQLGEDDAADLLEQNLREEQETLEELEQLAESSGSQAIEA